MTKPNYNDKGEAVNCFAYAPKTVKKAECSILQRGAWYNDNGMRCLNCPFFKGARRAKYDTERTNNC